jgi:ubiquinone/menaquinone biosynthesis C-methylase UbiE
MAEGHRFFAAVWDRQTRSEPKKLKQIRKAVAGAARGRVLEVGVGVGTNWAYLPAEVEYTGIEPDQFMLRRARLRAEKEGRAVTLEPFDVQSLPFADASFDTVITTLTFCSVPDAAKGLAEVHRVLKPGGQLRFYEHVRSSNPVYARLQRWLKPVTRGTAGGCEHDRDTVATIRAAGFDIQEMERQRVMGVPGVMGVASK